MLTKLLEIEHDIYCRTLITVCSSLSTKLSYYIFVYIIC